MKYRINIPLEANELMNTLESYGYSAYIVGGCVRDSILGRASHDWDICTSATKTYRIDGAYSDHRSLYKVTFTNNILEDLARRDFTMNAMAYNHKVGLIDPYGGLTSIHNKIIECVGLAKDRFNDDPLRILRAIRFAAQLDFAIEPDTALEINRQYINLKNVSIERIHCEFCEMLICRSCSNLLSLYKDVFTSFLPELKDCIGFEQNNPYHCYDVFDHTLNALEYCDSNDLTVRLAVLFHDVGKPHSCQEDEDGRRHFKGHGRISANITDGIMKRLRFDNDTRNNVVELIYYHDATFVVGKKYIKKWLNKIGLDQYRRLLELRRADVHGQNHKYLLERLEKLSEIEELLTEVLKEEECFKLNDLAISGKDLLKLGFQPGKELGDVLQVLLDKVITEELKNRKEDLITKAKDLLV